MTEPSTRWRRVTGTPGLPHGVTLLSLPWAGTTWYGRGAAYWRGRIGAVVVLAVLVAVYVLLYQLILGDAVHRSGYHTEFWVTAACMAVLTLVGAVFGSRRGVAGPPRILLLVSLVLAPGGWLVALVRQVLPTPPDERVAKADLARQLAGHHHS
ncbi:MAG TPA: hypothetical protein VGG05_05905 [Pseudonocardiaceae bacterium]|jgi:hypothetical protein